MTRACGGPNQALRASRSDQLHRSCERTARGGRGGGGMCCGVSTSGRISTYWPRKSGRPGPSKCTPRTIDPTGCSQETCLRFHWGRCWEQVTNST